MLMLGQASKLLLMNSVSPGVPNCSLPISKMALTSAAWSLSALMMASALQKNIPEFQKNSPDLRKTRANSSLGFSVNVLTAMKLSSTCSPTWMYP